MTLDEFLVGEGTREAARAKALMRVVAWQLSQEMEPQGLTKTALGGTRRFAPRTVRGGGRPAKSARLALG